MYKPKWLGLWLVLATSLSYAASDHHHDMGKQAGGCQGETLSNVNCGLRPSSVIDHKGRLWVSWVDAGHVYVSYSDDMGRAFAPPVAVNSIPEQVEARGESRAKIAIGRNGEVFVSYTQKLAKRFSGNIRFSRSLDGGRHFSDPITVNDNHEIIGHRFDTLWVTPDNRITLVWIDKRDREAAANKGESYGGAAIYYAVSKDGGKRFSANRKLADHSCECCRIALGQDSRGVVAVWRHIFGVNTRDHVLAHVGETAQIQRISQDEWRVEACPHHGPALAVDDQGNTHVAWYTQGERRKGLFYARRGAGGQGFSTPMALGQATQSAGHASIVTSAKAVHIVWREFDGEHYRIQYIHSEDTGLTWSRPMVVMQTSGDSDYPFLLGRNKEIYLAWQTAKEGYRLSRVFG